jgi:Cdc6-like AAA superfamily ATPase
MNHTKKFNPFKPNHPIHSDLFSGRIPEIKKINSLLSMIKSGNPSNLLIIGERGIGKTSLLLLINALARGKINLTNEESYNYLTIQFNLDENMNQLGLIKKINRALQRNLNKEEGAVAFIKKTWDFLKRIEIADSRLRDKECSIDSVEIFDDFVYSLSDTVNTFTSESLLSENGLKSKKDGILILIDEVDNASSELNLGTFLKNLSESLLIEGCSNIQFVLSGLPKIRQILSSSHQSSLRLFEEMELLPLETEDIASIFRKGLKTVNDKLEAEKYSFSPKALDLMVNVSEGYPHFIQQIGYSVFEINTDDEINLTTATEATFGEGGAIELIGTRYYYDMYYNQIKEDSYREILQIMANKLGDWVSRQEILSDFSKSSNILDNGIKALKKRNIILSKTGSRGWYKLQWMGFGFWIIFVTSKNTPLEE